MQRAWTRFFVLLTALMSAFPALATDAETTWENACEWIILTDTRLHVASYTGDGETLAYAFRPTRAIEAGTPVMVLDVYEDMYRIAYWQSGERFAWAPAKDVALRNPQTAKLHESVVNEGYTGLWANLPMTLHQGDTALPVRLVTLGTAQSIVYDGTQNIAVPTYDLSWKTDAEPMQQLACIDAPRTGKATLRVSTGSDARELMQCTAGTLVLVLTPGDTYTQIVCDGQTGYVLTSALAFLSATPLSGVTPMTLCYNGRTDNGATISLFMSASFARKVGEFPVGGTAMLFREGRTWSLVEVGGMRGYVKTAYLK